MSTWSGTTTESSAVSHVDRAKTPQRLKILGVRDGISVIYRPEDEDGVSGDASVIAVAVEAFGVYERQVREPNID